MSDSNPRPSRGPPPLMDRLGELCMSGKDKVSYLWQLPNDEAVRQEVATLLQEVRLECGKSGRREMLRILEEMEPAAAASPSPQQVEILQDGFDRLVRLWQSAKSGLF